MSYQNVRFFFYFSTYFLIQDVFTGVKDDLVDLRREIRRFANPRGLEKSEAVQSCAELGLKAYGEKVIDPNQGHNGDALKGECFVEDDFVLTCFSFDFEDGVYPEIKVSFRRKYTKSLLMFKLTASQMKILGILSSKVTQKFNVSYSAAKLCTDSKTIQVANFLHFLSDSKIAALSLNCRKTKSTVLLLDSFRERTKNFRIGKKKSFDLNRRRNSRSVD